MPAATIRSSVARRALAAVLLSTAAAAAGAAAPGSAAPDLDAVVSYETRQSLPSGVARIEAWREKLVRRGDTVWTERLGRVALAGAAHEHAGHRHFDFDAAARLLTRDRHGRTELRYVAAAQRLVVAVPEAEWSTAGFDGRFDAAAHLAPPALVERMPVEPRPAERGARWHVQRQGGWTHRVLWSAALQAALRIESRSDDGRSSRTVTLAPQPSARGGDVPWRDIGRYERRDWGDFSD